MPDLLRTGKKNSNSNLLRGQLQAGIYSYFLQTSKFLQSYVCMFWLRLVSYVCHLTAPFLAKGWRLHTSAHKHQHSNTALFRSSAPITPSHRITQVGRNNHKSSGSTTLLRAGSSELSHSVLSISRLEIPQPPQAICSRVLLPSQQKMFGLVFVVLVWGSCVCFVGEVFLLLSPYK